MTLPDPLTGELDIAFYHYERPDECSVCDSITAAFRYSWPDNAALRFAWQHVRSCPVALADCERGRVQLLSKADAGELAGVPRSWLAETARMIEAEQDTPTR